MQTKATLLLFLDTVMKQIMVAVQKCCTLLQKLKITHICRNFWPNFGKIRNKMMLLHYIWQGMYRVCECFEIMTSTSELYLDMWIIVSLAYHLGNNQEKKLLWSKRRFEKIIGHSKGWVTVSYKLTSFWLRVFKSFKLVQQQAQSLCLSTPSPSPPRRSSARQASWT